MMNRREFMKFTRGAVAKRTSEVVVMARKAFVAIDAATAARAHATIYTEQTSAQVEADAAEHIAELALLDAQAADLNLRCAQAVATSAERAAERAERSRQ